MHCLTPRTVGAGDTIPCGNCRFCRRKAQQVWGTRILLESYFYPYSLFGTLTYSDDTVPMADGVAQLHKPDITKFLEKLRYRTQHIRPLRYFIVGEYGDHTWRPHYHFILFGHGPEIEPMINDSWEHGFHQVAPLNFDRALYTARYCLKKMTRPDDEKLRGRMPEFSRMSTKPGIGTPAIGWLADTMGKPSMIERGPNGEFTYGPQLRAHGDVFTTVRIEGRLMPIGNFLRSKLRNALGLSDDVRERAIQLGRFDHHSGEIFDEVVPREYHPAADLADINSPWRRYAEKKASEAKAAQAAAHDAKITRQTQLFGSDRI